MLAASPSPLVAQDGVSPSSAPSPGPGAEDDSDRLTWGIQPSSEEGPTARAHFEYSLAPGEEVIDYVGVSNFSDRPIELLLYATDAFNTAAGAFALLERADPPSDVGSWVQLQRETLTIEARTRLDVPFLLRVPENATPGDHIGGIVAGLETTVTDGADGEVTVEQRIGTRIYLRVDGPLEPSLVLEELEASHEGSWHPTDGILRLRYLVRNDGNVRLSGTQVLAVEGPFGWRLKDLGLQALPEILPGESIPVTFDLPQVVPAVQLFTSLTIQPMQAGESPVLAGDPASRSVSTLAVPWMLLGIVVLIVEAGVLARWVMVRNRRRAEVRLAEIAAAARAAGREEGRALAEQGAQRPDATDQPAGGA